MVYAPVQIWSPQSTVIFPGLTMLSLDKFLISKEKEEALIQRLLAFEATAFPDLTSIFLDSLICWLVETNSEQIPRDYCVEAAEDALVSLVKSPRSFNPLKKRLLAYLRMSAQGDLRNILARESTHRCRKSLEAVELSPKGGKYLEVDDDPSLAVEIKEAFEKVLDGTSLPVLDGLTDSECRVLDMMNQGERKTEAFAAVLCIGHLSIDKQREEVKRVKDKLKKRLQRAKNGNVKRT